MQVRVEKHDGACERVAAVDVLESCVIGVHVALGKVHEHSLLLLGISHQLELLQELAERAVKCQGLEVE